MTVKMTVKMPSGLRAPFEADDGNGQLYVPEPEITEDKSWFGSQNEC